MTYQYHPNIPAGCPPREAAPADMKAYRFIESMPVAPQHFLSDVESNKRGNDPKKCACWGCSIWPSLAAAEHGRKIFHFFRKGYVVEGILMPPDGEVMATPSIKQPDHVTFWKDHTVDVAGRFQVILSPQSRP